MPTKIAYLPLSVSTSERSALIEYDPPATDRDGAWLLVRYEGQSYERYYSQTRYHARATAIEHAAAWADYGTEVIA